MDGRILNRMNKSQLRKTMSNLLKRLTTDERTNQSAAIFNTLVNHPKYREATRVSIYLSTSNEIDTIPILKHALEIDKKQCFVPVVGQFKDECDTDPRMKMIELKSMDEYDDLPVNRYGIKEPNVVDWRSHSRPNPLENNLDLVLVPGVAFSRSGHRLGHGKGYYDEYLNHWAKLAPHPVFTIGLALREQLIEDPLVCEGHDYKLDEVLYHGLL